MKYRIKYGILDNNIDITDTCMNKCIDSKSNIIHIPSNDNLRADIFTDPIKNIVKSVFIYDGDNLLHNYGSNTEIFIDTIENTINTIEHSNIPSYWKNWLKEFYLKVKDTDILQNIPVNSNKTAVIIEPRKHELLKYIIFNFMYLLAPKGWNLCVVCGTDNSEYVDEILQELKGGIYKVVLPYDNLTIDMYNKLLMNAGFYKIIPTKPKHILIFQTDTLLLKDNIDDFLEYSYVGAPWRHSFHQNKGMNGGLSLRNTQDMIRLCQNNKNIINENEDGFFSYTYSNQIKIPSIEEAVKFSVETYWPDDIIPCGFHSVYNYMPYERIQKALNFSSDKIFNKIVNNLNL